MPANSVNTAFQGVLSNDKSVIHLPRQYLQITNGGIYFKGYGEKKGNWQDTGFPVMEKEQYRLQKLIMKNTIIFWEWKRKIFGISCGS